ncbi:suppressor protein SRP40-like [Nematolebias whitei]|uniref:suppressor protein SRP40-like n=1 Tax=Nematolebias whitei TaxID=451745 RepID=UPI00189BC5E1|nr:suppressor protein SRP40-like [Nematolebias whitei]
MKEKGSDYSSTSKQTPTEKREGQSSDVSSTESSPSLTTSSVSTSSSSEPNKPQTKPSSSVGGIETSPSFSSSESVETLRDESSSTGQTAAAERTPGQEDEHIESAVRTSDHKGSAESSAAESDESIIEKLSETGPEQTLELIHQTLKLETNDGTPKEEEDGKSTKENEDVNAQILDSLNENKDEQRNKKERHTSGPEKDQGGLLVSEGVNEVKTCSKTKTDDSVKVKDGAASNQQRVEDEGSTVKPDQTDRTQTEDRETGKDKKTDEIISVGDESVPKKISLRRSSRGAKNTQETTGDKETITTRTTRGGRTEQDSAERGEGETRRTPEALKDVTPTETAEDSSEPQRKIPEDFQETEKDKEAATSRKRGRPRKTRQTPGKTNRTSLFDDRISLLFKRSLRSFEGSVG